MMYNCFRCVARVLFDDFDRKLNDSSMIRFKNYILHDCTFIMDKDLSSDEEIRDILSLNKVVVVGMSKNPSKAAHYVPKYLHDHGYFITPVNPNASKILDKNCFSSISEIDEEDIDIVDVFRPSDQVLSVVIDAIKKKPKVIWLQQGIHNKTAENLARKAGIKIVFNRCMLAEHKRLLS